MRANTLLVFNIQITVFDMVRRNQDARDRGCKLLRFCELWDSLSEEVDQPRGLEADAGS